MAFVDCSKKYALWDLAFLLVAAGYALIGLWGVTQLSANGLAISSDLCCYAQNIAGELHRGLFAQDPLLAVPTTANSIVNLQSALAGLLQPGGDIAQGPAAGPARRAFFSITPPSIIWAAACWARPCPPPCSLCLQA